jgi:hypothetical protein
MSDATLYKVLGAHGHSIHGGTANWFLPSEEEPGVWMPPAAGAICCVCGYHLVELRTLAQWLRADCTIYAAEGRGENDADGTGKTAFSQARLLRRVFLSEQDMRLFASDCAEHVLHVFEAYDPNDSRPRDAVAAARAYARGEITSRAAAFARAGDCATVAYDADAYVAYAAASAAYAACTPAYAADAASYAAYYAFYASSHQGQERQWQGERLATYLRETP